MMFDLDSMEVGESLVDSESRRDEWIQHRAGRFTCSRFGDLMQRDRTKDPNSFGQKAMAYIRQKFAEKLGSFRSFDAASLRWGRENEAGAIEAYECRSGNLVDFELYRLFVHPQLDFIAGTPDGLVFTEGTIEVKCPFNPAEHIQTLNTKTVPSQYEWQVHGHMLVTDRQWCDFVSFDPRMDVNEPRRLVVIRCNRDEAKLTELVRRLKLAKAKLDQMMGV